MRDLVRALDIDEATQRRARRAACAAGTAIASIRQRLARGRHRRRTVAPVAQLLELWPRQLVGFPRHLSQHVGGFVISEGPLAELVPVENAAMPERTVIQWDKDDLDDLGLLKVDVLALGMLTAIRQLLRRWSRDFHGSPTAALDTRCRRPTRRSTT